MARITNILMCFISLTAHLWKLSESVQRCKRYPNPRNGRMVCDSLFRLFCTPECNEGFMFEFKPAVVYMCGPLTGQWFTYPEGEKVPWPGCIKSGGSTGHAMEDEVARRRGKIARKIHDTNPYMFPQNHRLQQVQAGQPDARYLHLFSYIQRAQQVNNDKHTASLGFSNSFEQRKQLELRQQQQTQRQLQLRQQLQRRRHTIQQRKSIQQAQGELMKFQRQQQQAVKNQEKIRQLPPRIIWNTLGNLPPSSGTYSQPTASARRVAFTYYSTIPQVRNGKYSSYRAPQRNYDGRNVASPGVNQWQSNPDLISLSMVSPKQSDFIQSSPPQNQSLEGSNMPGNKGLGSLVSMSQTAPATGQRSVLSRILPSSDQGISRVENQLNGYLNSKPPIILTKTAEAQKTQFPVRSVSYSSQTHQERPRNVKSNHELNTTFNTQTQNKEDGGNNQTQEIPKKKEKLFYFPIKRDTLIQMLPLNLQEKYKFLREARNTNTSKETLINKQNIKTQDSIDINFQNVTQMRDPPTDISYYGHTIQQMTQPKDFSTQQSKSAVLNSSRNSSTFDIGSIESNAAAISASETAPQTLNYNFSSGQSSIINQSNETSVIEEYKQIPL